MLYKLCKVVQSTVMKTLPFEYIHISPIQTIVYDAVSKAGDYNNPLICLPTTAAALEHRLPYVCNTNFV